MQYRRLGVLALLLLPSVAFSQDAVIYRAKHILPVAAAPIEKGFVAVRGGKIVAVGRGGDDRNALDGQWKEIDLGDVTIIPGLVDTHSHIGIYSRPGVPANSDGNETSGPVQPGVRAIDAIYADDPGIRMATAGGVTVANIMPGSGNVIGGQTLYVKLRGDSVEAMRIVPEGVLGGVEIASGEHAQG